MLRKKGQRSRATASTRTATRSTSASSGVKTRQVLHYVRSLRMGGVGFYPHSQFVHSDTGRVRYWTGSASARARA